MYPRSSLAKFEFTHKPARVIPQFKFQRHNTAMVNSMIMNNTTTTTAGSKPRAIVFDGIRIIQDLRAVTGMCGACK